MLKKGRIRTAEDLSHICSFQGNLHHTDNNLNTRLDLSEKDTIRAQENKIKVQQDKIKVQEDKISAQEDKISAQEDKISAQEDKISAQEDKIGEQTERIYALGDKLGMLVREHSASLAQVLELNRPKYDK